MKALDRRARTGLLVGTLAMFFAIDVAFLVSLLGLDFIAAAGAQGIIELLPGFITVPLIELLKFWAERLLIAGVLGAFLVAGALAGMLYVDAARRTRAVAAVAVSPWLIAFLLGQLFAREKIDLAGSLADACAGAASQLLALALIAPGVIERDAPVAMPSRRRALVAGSAALAFLFVAAMTGLRGVAQAALGNVPATARRLRARATIAAGDPALDAVPGLAPRITANADHYEIDTALVKPRVDVLAWRLEIKGNVEEPFSLSYDQLLDLPAVEQPHTLECISNEIGGDLISTAVWTGVPLPDLLARARPKQATFKVVLRSVDGYSDSIPIAKAMEPQTIVAYLMNGNTVPQAHGFPARLLVPNIYGMKNVKWLASIELVTFDYQGYWMERGWSDVAIVNTNARIDVPTRTLRWNGAEAVVAGVAHAGSRGISKLEISTDGGRTWSDAQLEAAVGPLTWRRWSYRFVPAGPGPLRLIVRATDGTGQLQTSTKRDPFPTGATGYHAVDLNVVRG